MGELDHKEGWAPKNWCFWTVVLEKTLDRVPWTARRSNQSIIKEINPEYSSEGLMVKLKLPILWPPDVKNWLTGKDLDAGKDWRQEKGMTEDEMVGWHHRWVWVSSGSWWSIGRPGVLQSMGSQRVGHDWVNWWFLRRPGEVPQNLHFNRSLTVFFNCGLRSGPKFCIS